MAQKRRIKHTGITGIRGWPGCGVDRIGCGGNFVAPWPGGRGIHVQRRFFDPNLFAGIGPLLHGVGGNGNRIGF